MKLGILGTGTIVEEVLPVLAEKKQIKLHAICSTKRSAQKMQALKERYHITKGYDDFDALLADEGCDTVYIAVPNHLHYEYAKLALKADKHVIVEKPLTSHIKEAESLSALAAKKHLFLFEAITTMYSAHFQKIKSLLPRIGDLKLVSCNFSQYSRKYNDFLAGNIKPVFDVRKSGGVLMDLNCYNVHFTAGILGAPAAVTYHTVIEQGIDTGGILVMDYDKCNAVCIASKSSSAPCGCRLQGSLGYISQDTPANVCGPVTLHLNDGTEELYDLTPKDTEDAPHNSHRMSEEFDAFAAAIDGKDYALCQRMQKHSLTVSDILTRGRAFAGIVFPADENLPG